MVSKEVHGEMGLQRETNLEGKVLLEFADSRSLVLINTCFTKGGLKENYI